MRIVYPTAFQFSAILRMNGQLRRLV